MTRADVYVLLRNHVLSDLQPYICTIKHCPSASNRYVDRFSWMEHEKTHSQSSHIRGTQMPDDNIEKTCPLCAINLTSSANSNGRHVARHLEDIALSVLTMYLEDEEQSEDESSSATNSENSDLIKEDAEYPPLIHEHLKTDEEDEEFKNDKKHERDEKDRRYRVIGEALRGVDFEEFGQSEDLDGKVRDIIGKLK